MPGPHGHGPPVRPVSVHGPPRGSDRLAEGRGTLGRGLILRFAASMRRPWAKISSLSLSTNARRRRASAASPAVSFRGLITR